MNKEKKSKTASAAAAVKSKLVKKKTDKPKETAAKKDAVNKKVVFAAVSAVLLLLALFFSYVLLYPNAYLGMNFMGENLGGQSKEQLATTMKDIDDSLHEKNIIIKTSEKEYLLTLSSIDYTVNADASIEKVMVYGREGTIFTRVKAILSPNNCELVVSYDKELLKAQVLECYNTFYVEKEDPSFKIENDTLFADKGKDGMEFSAEDFLAFLEKRLMSAQADNIDITEHMIPVKPNKLTMEELKTQVAVEPTDAQYITRPDGSIAIQEEKNGYSFNDGQLKALLESDSITFSLPLTPIPPKIKSTDLPPASFTDVLGQATTSLNAGNVQRTKNVRLSANAVNGTVILPGEVFSFNKVVGQRSPEKGYVDAQIYTADGVVPGLAGGICQVSSTIYMATLYADLEVVERYNHTYTVSYTPYAQDATVVYGARDYRFKNNTDRPIKVMASQSGSTITVRILGTKTVNKTVTLKTTVLSTTAFSVREIMDPTMPAGKKSVDNGSNGVVATLHKTVTVNGQSTTTLVNKTVYSPLNKVIRTGTGGAAAPAEQEPNQNPTPEQPVTPEPPVQDPTPPPPAPEPTPEPAE